MFFYFNQIIRWLNATPTLDAQSRVHNCGSRGKFRHVDLVSAMWMAGKEGREVRVRWMESEGGRLVRPSGGREARVPLMAGRVKASLGPLTIGLHFNSNLNQMSKQLQLSHVSHCV